MNIETYLEFHNDAMRTLLFTMLSEQQPFTFMTNIRHLIGQHALPFDTEETGNGDIEITVDSQTMEYVRLDSDGFFFPLKFPNGDKVYTVGLSPITISEIYIEDMLVYENTMYSVIDEMALTVETIPEELDQVGIVKSMNAFMTNPENLKFFNK